MRVFATTDAPIDTDADTIAIGVFAGKGIPHDVADGTLQALVDAGEAKARFKSLAVAHADGRRWILVGLGERDAVGVEELIVSAHHDVAATVERAAVVAEAVNAMRDLQNTPANHMTPSALA